MVEPREQFVWTEKYRPQTIDDCILPKATMAMLAGMLGNKDTPNLLFHGKAGVGKTTVAKALTRQLNADTMVINASEEGNIDTLRTQIRDFCSARSFTGNRKFVILDEADYLTPATQPALRNFMEEFAAVCGFIMTANYPSRIIPALHSRCSLVDFKIPASERVKIATAFCERAGTILVTEGITHSSKVLQQVVANYFPDFRRILNELQRFSTSGALSEEILAQLSDRDVVALFDAIKKKDFAGLRKWLNAHEDMDEAAFYRMLYEQVAQRIDKSCLTESIILMADYAARSGYSADKQLNNLAVLVELMKGGVWQ
jgi:DNA polymerase III delta prime subunit